MLNAEEDKAKMTPPGSTLAEMAGVLPGFQEYWDGPENLFLEDDGSYSACGVFSMAATFVRDNYRDLSDETWVQLAGLVQRWYGESDDMRGCLGACFIENLQWEACTIKVAQYIEPEILNHFHFEGKVDY